MSSVQILIIMLACTFVVGMVVGFVIGYFVNEYDRRNYCVNYELHTRLRNKRFKDIEVK